MRIISLLLIFLLVATGCKKETDRCSQYGWTPVTGVRYMGKTNTGAQGQDGVFYDVYATFTTSCYALNRLVETKVNDTIVIKAEYVLNTCIACTQLGSVQAKTYSFIPAAPGTYYIKWDGLPNRMDTVVIP